MNIHALNEINRSLCARENNLNAPVGIFEVEGIISDFENLPTEDMISRINSPADCNIHVAFISWRTKEILMELISLFSDKIQSSSSWSADRGLSYRFFRLLCLRQRAQQSPAVIIRAVLKIRGGMYVVHTARAREMRQSPPSPRPFSLTSSNTYTTHLAIHSADTIALKAARVEMQARKGLVKWMRSSHLVLAFVFRWRPGRAESGRIPRRIKLPPTLKKKTHTHTAG